MNQIKQSAFAETPKPAESWFFLSDNERLILTKNALNKNLEKLNELFELVDAKSDGQIIVKAHKTLTADKRGTLLLDLEDFFKKSIDMSLVVWLEPFGDRNSLRNLRGIEVKS